VATGAIKTYIRPAWVCMSIRLHISVVSGSAFMVQLVGSKICKEREMADDQSILVGCFWVFQKLLSLLIAIFAFSV